MKFNFWKNYYKSFCCLALKPLKYSPYDLWCVCIFIVNARHNVCYSDWKLNIIPYVEPHPLLQFLWRRGSHQGEKKLTIEEINIIGKWSLKLSLKHVLWLFIVNDARASDFCKCHLMHSVGFVGHSDYVACSEKNQLMLFLNSYLDRKSPYSYLNFDLMYKIPIWILFSPRIEIQELKESCFILLTVWNLPRVMFRIW